MAGTNSYKRRKARKAQIHVDTKMVRIDDHTQIEVPVHLSDAVAIERYLLRRKPVLIPVKNKEAKKLEKETPDENELLDFLNDDPELAVDEEGGE